MASYGQGWGSQIVATVGTQSSAVLNDDGKLETMPAWNLGTGACFNLSKTLATNLNYYGIDPSIYRDENKIKSGSSGHLNLIWSPIKNVNADDNSGVGTRLQLMTKYLF